MFSANIAANGNVVPLRGAPMASPKSALRRDTRQTRDRLLDAVGQLLAESGPTFGLPELARRGEVATATAYRHFETVHDAYNQYLLRTVEQLAAALGSVARSRTARGRFEGACAKWAEQALAWGPAIVHIRNWRGLLQRLHDQNPTIIAVYAALEPIVLALIEDKIIPEQDIEYAILIWVTLFDERVIIDLGEAKGWSSDRIAKQLGSSVLYALGGNQAELPGHPGTAARSPGSRRSVVQHDDRPAANVPLLEIVECAQRVVPPVPDQIGSDAAGPGQRNKFVQLVAGAAVWPGE
jgi:AcrR family transcriptional regulator